MLKRPFFIFISLILYVSSHAIGTETNYQSGNEQLSRSSLVELKNPLITKQTDLENNAIQPSAPLWRSGTFKKNYKTVLSLDGGGVRGIIEAYILHQFEEHTGMKTWQLFDLVVGTSTGGIVGAGVTIPCKPNKDKSNTNPTDKVADLEPYSAKDMITLFETKAQQIFKNSIKYNLSYYACCCSQAEYSPSGLENLLNEYFEETTLDKALIPLVLTSVDTLNNWLTLLKSYPNFEKPEDFEQFKVKDACRATSAAPTYFPPAYITAQNKDKSYTLVDGGIAVNNPCDIGLIEALKKFPNEKIKVISIGTGGVTGRFKNAKEASDRMTSMSKIDMVRPLIDMALDAQSDDANYTISRYYETQNKNKNEYYYYRFQPELDAEGVKQNKYDLDQVASISKLKQIARNYMASDRYKVPGKEDDPDAPLVRKVYVDLIKDLWSLTLNEGDIQFD